MAKTKGHTRYKLKSGQRVPGVTTILGNLAKPALISWANRMGLKGIDTAKYVDDKAAIGTLIHSMIISHLKSEKIDTSDYSKNQIDQAENGMLSFYEWEKTQKIMPEFLERPLVSEKYKFGGTFDFFGKINGQTVLMDFKTGKGIYPEFFYQLAAYSLLLKEILPDVYIDNYMLLNIGRDENESFRVESKKDIEKDKQIFLTCHKLYNLIKKGE